MYQSYCRILGIVKLHYINDMNVEAISFFFCYTKLYFNLLISVLTVLHRDLDEFYRLIACPRGCQYLMEDYSLLGWPDSPSIQRENKCIFFFCEMSHHFLPNHCVLTDVKESTFFEEQSSPVYATETWSFRSGWTKWK